MTAEWRPGSTPVATYTSSRTCRACDGTGLAAFGVDCTRCHGTGNAAPGDVPRDPSADERNRRAPSDAAIRRLHDLVAQCDEREPAVMLASDALGRSDADADVIAAHIATLTVLRSQRGVVIPPQQLAQRPRARRGRAAPRTTTPVRRAPGITYHRQTFRMDLCEMRDEIVAGVRRLVALYQRLRRLVARSNDSS